jgi:hypothetical protein
MGKKLYGGFGRIGPTSSFWTCCCPGWEANMCCYFFSKTGRQLAFR